MTHDARPLDARYLHLAGDGSWRAVAAGDFWAEVEAGRHTERDDAVLVSCFAYDADWPTAEMHPHGDEPVFVLDGWIDVLLAVEDGEERVEVRGGQVCVVPAGVWHRALVHAPTRAVHLTPGAGTGHRPAPEGHAGTFPPAAVRASHARDFDARFDGGRVVTGPGPGWHASVTGAATLGPDAAVVALADGVSVDGVPVPAGHALAPRPEATPRALTAAPGAALVLRFER